MKKLFLIFLTILICNSLSKKKHEKYTVDQELCSKRFPDNLKERIFKFFISDGMESKKK